MPQLTLLLPLGLPPIELAADIGKALQLPALSALLGRASPVVPARTGHSSDAIGSSAYARMLPHEAWLARAFHALPKSDSSPAIAGRIVRQFGIDVPQDTAATWFIVQPVHFHIALDHLVLTDLRHSTLTGEESRALFDAAMPAFNDAGVTLHYGDAHTWLARADAWSGLLTSTPDAACGHNIDIWMPQGEQARQWRKLVNEVQMTWFTHPLQTLREQRGLKPVNSMWIWGGETGIAPATPSSPYDAVFNAHGWMSALVGKVSGTASGDAATVLASNAPSSLVVLDALCESALAADWGRWIAELQQLEAEWFAPLLKALQDGKLDTMTLVTSDSTRLAEWRCSRGALRKFWNKPSLARLLS